MVSGRFKIYSGKYPKQFIKASQDKKFTKNCPVNSSLAIEDEKSGHYVNVKDSKKYYDSWSIPPYHNEVLALHSRKLYFPVTMATSYKEVKDIANLFERFVEENIGESTSCSIRKDLKKCEYIIVADETFIKNAPEASQLILSFWKSLPDEKSNKINLKAALEHDEDLKRPTLFNPYHVSDIKNEYINLSNRPSIDNDKQLELLIKSLLSQNPKNIKNITININSHNTNINNDNDSSDDALFAENLSDFVDYIIEQQPSWYKPGKFMPKKLLTDKFNTKYDCDITSNKMSVLLKKLNLKDKIIGSEMSRKYEDDEYDYKKYRGFIAKPLT